MDRLLCVKCGARRAARITGTKKPLCAPCMRERDRTRTGDGVQTGKAKLTDDDVRGIRAMRREGATQQQIAERYAVSRATVIRALTDEYNPTREAMQHD